MGDSLDTAVNSLSEQTKKINIALFYTGNDMDKAKQMVAGSFKDVLVLKLKFKSSSLYGAIIAFISVTHIKVIDSFFVASNDYLIDNIENSKDWKIFESEIASHREGITDFRLILEIKDKFDRGFNGAVCNSVIKLSEKNDSIQLSHVLQKFVQDSTGLQRVDINIDYQMISSLDMELDSISSRKMDAKPALVEQKTDVPAEEKIVPDQDEIKAGANGIKAIIRASLILSPIKGKHIEELKIGDRVLISLIEMNDHSRSIAKAFNAFNAEENKILPIPARIKSLRYIDGTGFKIYVVIAKGIIGQIIEEEKNIKVALDPAAMLENADEKEEKGKAGLVMIIGLVAVIIILLAIIIVIAI
ncbi:MAG TPA: hypothetical protein VF857_09510 [Spirochaetota bacterium]